MIEAAKAAISLIPIIGFVLGLIFMDGYKLTPWKMVGFCFFSGLAAAAFSLGCDRFFFAAFPWPEENYSRYLAPIIEEGSKALYLLFLFRKKKIGFLVDAAIYGALIGAGFAFLENGLYLLTWTENNFLLWTVRGFGTALMHSGMTALVAVLTKACLDIWECPLIPAMIPGFLTAVLIHSLFNHFVFSPVVATLILLLVIPPIVLITFTLSERRLKHWLMASFDSDVAMLEMITEGYLLDSRTGMYLRSLQDRFPGEILADMICYIRIHVELSLKAKGILLLKENGLPPQPDCQVPDLLRELDYLKKSLGYAGCLAVAPILHHTDRELWQLHLFNQAGGK